MATDAPWLAVLAFGPVAGAALVALLPQPRSPLTIHRLLPTGTALLATGLLALLVRGVAAGPGTPEVFTHAFAWVPTLEVELALVGDRLSLFFAAAALLVGAVVAGYASGYFREETDFDARRFHALLLLFMGAMVLTVCADHLLVLYAGWEATSVLSFLLIATDRRDRAATHAARRALCVTFATGLCLLAGLVLLAHLGGTWRISELLAAPDVAWTRSAAFPAAVALMALGAFGKSAQLPFHFWLTGAMAAPTPVSAYLHAATMVKLGLYLATRFDPLFAAWPGWTALLIAVGGTTMMVTGICAFIARELKAMLAFSTISSLGYLLLLAGLDHPGLAASLPFHTGNHVFYKAALFMIAGLVIHAAGRSRIDELGGLAGRMPVVAGITAVALASMVGLPGTAGFVSKESILHGVESPGLLLVLAGGFALKMTFACRFFGGVFLGETPAGLTQHLHHHSPPRIMTVMPALLAAVVLGAGLAPAGPAHLLESLPVLGRPALVEAELKAWPKPGPGLAITAAALAAGIGLHAWLRRSRAYAASLPVAIRLESAFDRGLGGARRGARIVLRALQVDRTAAFLPILLATLAAGAAGVAGAAGGAWRLHISTEAVPPLRLLIGSLVLLAAAGVIRLRHPAARVVSLSATGFLICIYFVMVRAPDLALTQILVEVVALILVLFLLARFPAAMHERQQHAPATSRRRRLLSGALAISIGTLTTLALLAFGSPPLGRAVGRRHLAAAEPEAHSGNAVNAIVTEFRALDTLFEITVLLSAMIAGITLLMRYRRKTGRPT